MNIMDSWIRNRRGIVIAFGNQGQYELVLNNQDCFLSGHADGGVYFPPELVASVENGNLHISYLHGRYGYRVYKFRYQNAGFELIGYDSSQDRGPIVERLVSINFLTQNILIRENMNPDTEAGNDEKFREIWRSFTLPKPIRLSEISDFDYLNTESLLAQDR